MINHIIKNKKLSPGGYPVGEYIHDWIEKAKIMVAEFKKIESFRDRPVNIICQGSSGAIIATIFADAIPGSIISNVKKPGETSHSGSFFEYSPTAVNVIVDDFISTGKTMQRIYEFIQSGRGSFEAKIDCVCVCGGINRAYNLPFDTDYIITGYYDD